MHKEFKFHFEFSLETIVKGFLVVSGLVFIVLAILHWLGFVGHDVARIACDATVIAYIVRYFLYDSEGILTKKKE